MSEWWTYTLSDFLLFSPRTYYRLLELYNVAIWPVQLAGLAIGVSIAVLLFGKRNRRDRSIAGLLAVCWLWIAWAFHYERYAQINTAAPWFAAAFALQALLLAGFSAFPGRVALGTAQDGDARIRSAIVAIAVVGYPLLAPLAGRSWTSAEVFGAAPDPTAIATVAALGLVHGRRRALLLVVPLLWCLVSAATLWAMNSPEAVLVAGSAVLAIVMAARRMRTRAPAAMR